MTISERTLKEWRRQALIDHRALQGWDSNIEYTSHRRESCERILRLTQELLDIHLVKRSTTPKPVIKSNIEPEFTVETE